MTLSHTSRTWYLSLPKGSIHSFEQLVELFMSRFLANKTLQQSPTYLMTIRREQTNPYDYVRHFRFSTATIITKGVTDEWAI